MASQSFSRGGEFQRKELKDPITPFSHAVLLSEARSRSRADANQRVQPLSLTTSRQVRCPHFFNKRQKLSSLSRFPAYSL
jgi:hypothetical protein